MDKRAILVLVVDDDEDDFILVRDLLDDVPGREFEVEWVSTYKAGLEALMSGKHDVCLVDYLLGERSGLDLLRDAVEQGCRTPMVLMTGVGGYDTDIEAMRAGASDFLVKSEATAPLLERTLRYVMDRRRGEDDLEAANGRLTLALDQARQMAISAEAANAVKSQFLTNVSHELRTPLNGIMGLVSLILDWKLDEQQREDVLMLNDCAAALRQVIDNVLDFAGIESDARGGRTVDFSPRTTMEEMVAHFSQQAADAGIKLRHEIGDGVAGLVNGDPARLRQVLFHLIGNAVKFTREGEVLIQVTPNATVNGEISLSFSVTDTGIGIDHAKQAVIFDPFVQADGSSTREFGGTGLGLAICRQLVHLMRGELTVDSEPNRGSSFSFTATFAGVKANDTGRLPVAANAGESPQ